MTRYDSGPDAVLACVYQLSNLKKSAYYKLGKYELMGFSAVRVSYFITSYIIPSDP